MKYQPPFVPGATPGAAGIYNADPNAPYINGDPAQGQEGSYFPGEALEHHQRELVKLITTSGQTPDHLNLAQVAESATRYASGGVYYADGGSANDYDLSIPSGVNGFVPPSAYFPGMQMRFVAGSTNTGASTANAPNLPKKDIRLEGGAALSGGEMVAGRRVALEYDGSMFILLRWTAAGTAAALQSLPTGVPTLTLYVRTDGVDEPSRTGLNNTTADAFATISYALSYTRDNWNLVGRKLQIRLGNAGTYAPFALVNAGIVVEVLGDIAAQESYILSGNGAGRAGVVSAAGSRLALRGLRINNTGNTANDVYAANDGSIELSNVTFGFTSAVNSAAYCNANNDGSITLGPGIKMARSMGIALTAFGGVISCVSGSDIEMQGGPVFTQFAQASGGGQVWFTGTTFVGGANGKRFYVQSNGVITTFGAGVNYLPGALAGTTTTGGVYV